MGVIFFLFVMQVGKPFRFHTPPSILVVGPSGCDKIVFTEKLLLENADLFETPPTQAHYCYGAWQDRFQPMQDRGVMFHEGIPNHQALVQWFPQWQGVLVLDDLMDEGSNDKNGYWNYSPNIPIIKTSRSFTCAKTCFPWVNMPKVFPAMPITSRPSRTRGINWGDATSSLNRFPLLGKTVWKTFHHATARPFGYLVLDLHPASSDQQRLLSHVLKSEGRTRTYQKRRDQTQDVK